MGGGCSQQLAIAQVSIAEGFVSAELLTRLHPVGSLVTQLQAQPVVEVGYSTAMKPRHFGVVPD